MDHRKDKDGKNGKDAEDKEPINKDEENYELNVNDSSESSTSSKSESSRSDVVQQHMHSQPGNTPPATVHQKPLRKRKSESDPDAKKRKRNRHAKKNSSDNERSMSNWRRIVLLVKFYSWFWLFIAPDHGEIVLIDWLANNEFSD